MSGLQNTLKRAMSASSGQGWTTSQERHAKRTATQKKAKDDIYANADMPDEEVIARNERRKAAKRKGSRVASVMTGDDALGG